VIEVKTQFRDGQQNAFDEGLVASFPGPEIGPFKAAIWEDGRLTSLTSEGASGPPFPLGCLQDAMIGALLCALADDGVLSLDDEVAQHLHELRAATVGSAAPRLSHLLSHSTGLWVDKPTSKEVILDWPDFCQLLTPAVPRFPPGGMSVHSLLDRILLLKVVERAVGRSAYDELRARFFAAPNSIDTQPQPGQLMRCYLEVHGTLATCADFLQSAAQTSWPSQIAAGAMRPITQSPNVRPWAPVADGLGLFRLANGILGQDGDHPNLGFVGLRLSPTGRTAVIGHFRSSAARDHVLNRLVSDMMDVEPPPKSALLGDLNGFEPSELPGSYRGIWGLTRHVGVSEGALSMAASRELRPLVANIQADGALTGRWAAPNLWIEPQSLGDDGLVGFRFGKHLYVKERGHEHFFNG
jgi:CubicO group peptidase (beta-lactamase class C family)